MASAPGPETSSLAGWEWRGWNVTPLASLLGIRKFVKGFFRLGSAAEGYNIPVRQNRLGEAWIHKPSPDAPLRFGFFDVCAVVPGERDSRYPRAVLLDYGSNLRNARHRVERLLRDYLVRPDPVRDDLLLGKAYLAFGPVRLPAGFFVIERLRPTSWAPGP